MEVLEVNKEIKNQKQNIISAVYPGSIAEELEIEVGDVLLSINDKEVTDIIDYLFWVTDDYLEIEIEKADGEIWALEIEKDPDEELGIEFTNPIMDCAQSCSNKCVFCFIDQTPKGMRESLYFKDDDSRLSFLQGNFLTLTNLKEADIDRIVDYNISPINVSVHTTNAELRKKMLHNKFAGNILDRLKKLTGNRVVVNGQIVVCPGYNDGQELINTVNDLYDLGENFETIAIVPVGISDHREGLAELRPVTKELAIETVEAIEALQEKFLKESGRRFAYLSDEFYLLADKPMPDVDYYDGFGLLENGIGLMTKLKWEVASILETLDENDVVEKSLTIGTGKLAEPFIRELAQMIMNKTSKVTIKVVGIQNDFYGHLITVAGLVTGQDLVKQLKGQVEGDLLLVPRVMMKSDEMVFLDDYTIEDVEEELSIKVKSVLNEGADFIEQILF
jgi:putative radical SAM enzyme (TIGR03279 family)